MEVPPLWDQSPAPHRLLSDRPHPLSLPSPWAWDRRNQARGVVISLDRHQGLWTNGFTIIPEALSAQVQQSLLLTAKALQADPGRRSRQVLYTHTDTPQGSPHLDALLDQWLSPHRRQGAQSTLPAIEALRPLARELLGEEPVVFQDLILVKRPGQKPFPWHQDYGFWPIDRPDGVVLWTPLAGCDPTKGALRVAKGSHGLGERPVVDLQVSTALASEDNT